MGKIFFTSDLHFGHENVLKFDNRPFSTVEEMNAELIRRWNAKVKADDTVYVIGDMIWPSSTNDAPAIIKQLNGHIVLIKGNHDRFIQNRKVAALFDDIKDYGDVCVTLEDGTVRRCILSHYFIPMYIGHRYSAIQLYGHSHTSEEAPVEREISTMLNQRGIRNESYNVGCMYWNYEPVTLDEILSAKSTDYKKGELITIEVDFEIYAKLRDMVEPYGMIPADVVQLFFKWLVDPATQEEATAWVQKVKEQFNTDGE